MRFLRSFLIPIKLKKEIVDGDVLKTNQLLGSWIAILSKLKYNSNTNKMPRLAATTTLTFF